MREHRRKALLLSWLSQSLQDATNIYQENVIRQIFQYGLKRLPDEILGDICEILCEDTSSAKHYAITLGRFQLVCRRFRDVALDRVRLWTSVQDDMPVERIELQILRCTDVGMSFHISYPQNRTNRDGDRCSCRKWEVIKRYGHRWTHGYIFIGNVPPYDDHFCIEQLRFLCLPSLSTVKLNVVDDDRICSTLLTWQFPRLEQFHSERGPILALPLSNPLNKMVLQFGGFSIRHLISVLSRPTALSLTELTFKFSSVFVNDLAFGFPDASESIRMGRIHKLVVMMDRTFPTEGFQFLQLLEVPNVAQVSVQVDFRLTFLPAFYDWLNALGRGITRGVASMTIPLLEAESRSQEIETRINDCLLPFNTGNFDAEGGGAVITIYVFDPAMPH